MPDLTKAASKLYTRCIKWTIQIMSSMIRYGRLVNTLDAPFPIINSRLLLLPVGTT